MTKVRKKLAKQKEKIKKNWTLHKVVLNLGLIALLG